MIGPSPITALQEARKARLCRIDAAGQRFADSLTEARRVSQITILERAIVVAEKKPTAVAIAPPTVTLPEPVATLTKEGLPLQIITIQGAVAEKFGLKRADLTGQRRTANVVLPRQIAVYLCRKMTTRSLPDIGRRFGGRDHTTMLHSISRVGTLIARDPAIAQTVSELSEALS